MQNYFGYNICCMCVFSQRKANILLLSSCCNQIRFCQNIFTASHSSCTVAPCFFEQASCGHLQKHRWKKKCTFAVYYKLYDSWVLILNIIDIAKSSRIYFQSVSKFWNLSITFYNIFYLMLLYLVQYPTTIYMDLYKLWTIAKVMRQMNKITPNK